MTDCPGSNKPAVEGSVRALKGRYGSTWKGKCPECGAKRVQVKQGSILTHHKPGSNN